MTFAAPQWFWALVLVPVLLASLHRRGRATDPGAGGSGRARWLWVDARGVRPVPPARRGPTRGLWAALALALGATALAQPQWGSEEEVQFDPAREVLIALDLSRSMLAEDVPPSRLGRARLLVESTLDELEGERVGLLLFAGTAFLQSPLSADHEVLREILPVLEPGYLPQSGTDFDAMVDAAVDAFSQTGSADRYLVVLSDGESESFDLEAIEKLREAGVRVIALGIGTEAGALIPDGAGGIVKDDRGAAVLSRLERGVLERLADETSGVYVDAASWLDLADLVERTVARGRAGEFAERRERLAVHRFQWWLAPAVLALLLSHLFELPASPRARSIRGRGGERERSVPDERVRAEPRAEPREGRALGATRAGASGVWIGLAIAAAGVSFAPITRAAEPPAQAPNPLVELVGRLAIVPERTADDYAELARTTLDLGRAQLQAGEPLPDGAIRDGLVSVQVGESMDAETTDWAALRHGLESLLQRPPQPPSQEGEAGEQGDSKQSGGGQDGEGQKGPRADAQPGDPSGSSQSGEGDDDQRDAQGREPGEPGSTDGSSGEPGSPSSGSSDPSEPGSDDASTASAGERERGDPQAMTDAQAGFGDLGEEPGSDPDEGRPDDADDVGEDAAPGASAAAGETGEAPDTDSRPSRLVGGTRTANEELIQARPDLAAAVGRMERVRDGDAPAVLFDRMNEAEGQRDRDGGSRW